MGTDNYQAQVFYDKTAQIAGGADLSEAVDLAGCVIAGVVTDGNLVGTTITIHASTAYDGTYSALKDASGSDVSFTAGTDDFISLGAKRDILNAVRFLKFSSSAAQASLASTLTLITTPNKG